jgi:hypothetical protein
MHEPTHISEADMNDIESFLRGELAGGELQAFEQRLVSQPSLSAELARQRVLETAVARLVPSPRDGLAAAQIAHAIAVAGRGSGADSSARALPRVGLAWLRPAMLAAAAALVLLATVAVLSVRTSSKPLAPTPFAVVIANGFAPSIAETDPTNLEAMIIEKLGKQLSLPRDNSIQYAGIRTDVGGSPLAFGIVMRVNGNPVLLSLDAAGPIPDTAVTTTSPTPNTYRHERILNGIRVVEWSQSDASVVKLK